MKEAENVVDLREHSKLKNQKFQQSAKYTEDNLQAERKRDIDKEVDIGEIGKCSGAIWKVAVLFQTHLH